MELEVNLKFSFYRTWVICGRLLSLVIGGKKGKGKGFFGRKVTYGFKFRVMLLLLLITGGYLSGKEFEDVVGG